MDDATRNAKLEALLTRGPWSGEEWHGKGKWTLTPTELRAYYEAIKVGVPRPAETTLQCGQSDRRADRAAQLLRTAGLIRYKKGKGWVAV